MKNLILSLVGLTAATASMALLGTTTAVAGPVKYEGLLPLIPESYVEEKETAETKEYNVIAERNAGVAKQEKEEAERKAKEEAERKAKEEAERKAAEEAAATHKAQSSSSTSHQVNNSTSNHTSNNTNTSSNTSNTVPSRAENTTVRGVPVYISSIVSDSDYNRVIGWISNMPSFLLNHVSSINVVSNIQDYTITGGDASGITKGGHDIYLKAQGVSGRLGSLYHEAGHCLDFYGGYSNSSTWQAICSAEWAGEGHYASSNESFAEAISRYYVDGLSKPQSKQAIESLLNTGSLGSGDGFQAISRTLHADPKIIYVYSGPNDFYSEVITTVPIGETCTAIGINGDGTWYKVEANGVTGYVNVAMVDWVD